MTRRTSCCERSASSSASEAVLAYKFLHQGRVGIFSGFAWPVGKWVSVDGPLLPSRRGVHACRLEDLPHWLDDELWLAELDGEIIDEPRMLVAKRGRLVERLAGWDSGTAGEFTLACLARDHAQPELSADAAEWAEHPDGAVSAVYIVAHAAGVAAEKAGRPYEEGFSAERAWQADWLARRLGLNS
jgi:hypothetical protein